LNVNSAELKGAMKVLIVCTSNSDMGTTGKKTGMWLEEYCAPYYVLQVLTVALNRDDPTSPLCPFP
jgi:hypothetical protein